MRVAGPAPHRQIPLHEIPYGARGAGDVIPSDARLVFEVEPLAVD